MRGAYTAGCLTWLLDHDIEFDGNYGISTGAVNLCSFLLKSRTHLFRFFTEYIADKKAIGWRPFLREGHIVSYGYLFDKLMVESGFKMDGLKDLTSIAKIGLYDLAESRTAYHEAQGMDREMLKAACTLPILGKVVKKDGHEYLDGGITKMIPIEEAVSDGMERHLIIATKPIDYVRKPANIFVRLLMRIVYHKCPQIEKDYKVRHLNYQKQISLIRDLVDKKEAVYMCPSHKTNVTRLGGSPEELVELFELGKADMEAQKEEIFALLK